MLEAGRARGLVGVGQALAVVSRSLEAIPAGVRADHRPPALGLVHQAEAVAPPARAERGPVGPRALLRPPRMRDVLVHDVLTRPWLAGDDEHRSAEVVVQLPR